MTPRLDFLADLEISTILAIIPIICLHANQWNTFLTSVQLFLVFCSHILCGILALLQ